ncbi:heptaprenyl diphosphate synthase component II [Marininema halotolerans]|uniref:Heptaprenyl diphosphate synthase component 2 n=1 Tax=Marininema halotolerans TaxID=1155944 RepID=A0A1I6TYS2_9BACL|nr:heptaprenyl diphosphate synthase component II [Marininema halotolerans]SFS94342.1 heptaprenyl diphosphate synthase [Marininema halotolerans]
MKLSDIYKNLRNDLQLIEQELGESVQSDFDALKHSSVHLLEAGGKRMRPVFVLLSGKFGAYNIERLKHVAVPLELIHMATLVHDDVIDDAATRRGQETVKAKWDNRVAMYTGDYIFARALTIAATIEIPEVHRVLSDAIMQMCIGEVEQIKDFYNHEQSIRTYLHRIKRKTALLMATSCQLGALVGEADRDTVRRLRLYGYYVGMAFQITDDVLDLIGEEEELGKPAGSDLRQGNVTLPVIYALKNGSNEDREAIIRYLKEGEEGRPLGEILQRVRQSEGIAWSQALAERYLNKAFSILEGLPDGEARSSLRLVAEFVGGRSY